MLKLFSFIYIKSFISKKGILSILLLLISGCVVTAQTQKPNIILILTDDIGYKALTCNGGNLYSTPNVDTFAKEGMRFTQCHSTPTCSPSRITLLTGKYNFRNYTEWGVLDPHQKTIGNMMHDAGYNTAYFGKDQLDGGGISLQDFGFDNYIVHGPFTSGQSGSTYKSPHLYTHGAFLNDNVTANKYSEDIFTDSLIEFMKGNTRNPFFIYYPMVLVHQPFSPTPDDAAFNTWTTGNEHYDTAFFPSMVHYMDKKIAEILSVVKQLGIDSNTVIIFTSDNGTPHNVSDYANDDGNVEGGKSFTTELGIHVPLLVRWPGTVKQGAVNNDLVSLTDLLPTIADIAGIQLPDFGPFDGVSFAPRLYGDQGNPGSSLYYYYYPHPNDDRFNEWPVRWAQTSEYKLYDTSQGSKDRRFYNITKDSNETHPIPDDLLTPAEITIKQQLLDKITLYLQRGQALLFDPKQSSITDSSATIINSIALDGGSTITASGVAWSQDSNKIYLLSNHTSNNVC
ncbi:MAG: sulfatase-like hydrolase/transferase, partial [Parafilimonas sp.]|nr:sulfatase-like hydrolase/transferase [Parafilimonas sp.]